MIDCHWAQNLTKYDCRPIKGLTGADGLEIGTPFTLPGGAAINFYIIPEGNHILISDNGDTVFHLASLGLDVMQHRRAKSLRDTIAPYKITLDDRGDFRAITNTENAPFVFAQAITAIIAIAHWASTELQIEPKEQDLAAEAEPYIRARDQSARFIRNPEFMGASRIKHQFHFLHGIELIDVISANSISTGAVMRKLGDLNNGPFIEGYDPLIIVDDRINAVKAHSEISILGSLAKAQPFSSLMLVHH